MRTLALFLLCSLGWSAPARAADPDPWFGADKALHYGASAGLAGLGYGAASLVWDDTGLRLGFGASVALTAGIAKELVDLAGHGTPSWKDLTWDVLGTATGLLVAWGIDLLVRRLAVPAPAASRNLPSRAPQAGSALVFVVTPLGVR